MINHQDDAMGHCRFSTRSFQADIVPTMSVIAGLVVIAAMGPFHLIAAERASSKEREHLTVETVLRWLPADTEAIDVAQSFDLQIIDWNTMTPDTPGLLMSIVRDSSMGPLRELRDGKYAKSLVGRRLAMTVSARRAIETFDAWGSQRYQGCDILIFQEDLGPIGAALEQKWRRECKLVQNVDRQTLYCFERSGTRKPYIKDLEWEGTFICQPAPNVLIFANQVAFLKAVLERRRVKPRDRTLPDRLPLWRNVDRKAPAWMVRHAQMKTTVGLQAAAWTLAIEEPPGQIVLNFSPDDRQSAATSRTAARRIDDWARTFELKSELKEASDGSARLRVRLPKAQPGQSRDLVGFGFFFVKLIADPVVDAPL